MNADCDSNASFGMRYGPVKMTAPMAAALPAIGYAPTSSRWSAAIPRILPSSSAATVTVQRSARDDVAASRFSRRSSIHLSGLPRW